MRLPVELISAAANIFRGLDMNFQFYSTDQLPEKAKKIIGSEMDEILKMPALHQIDEAIISKLCDSITSFEYLTISMHGCYHLTTSLPGFSKLVRKNLTEGKK